MKYKKKMIYIVEAKRKIYLNQSYKYYIDLNVTEKRKGKKKSQTGNWKKRRRRVKGSTMDNAGEEVISNSWELKLQP